MKLLGMFSRGHQPDVDALSALADGGLTAGDAAAMRKHLTSCEACRTRLDELRQVRSKLTALPRADAPRSFRLRPADVQELTPARAASSAAGAMRAMPALAGLAAVLLAAVIAVDAASRTGSDSSSRGDAYQASAPRESDMQTSNGFAEDSAGPTTRAAGDAVGEKTADDAGAGALAPQPRAPEAATSPQLSPTAAPAARAAQPTAAPPSPDTASPGHQLSDDGDDSRTGWRIAEAVLGAIAAGAAGIAIFSWRARQR
jgi:hypothetical protein